jgi:CheY-like chemotaxis protein
VNEMRNARATVLVVEDIDSLRSAMRKRIEGYGFAVVEAADAAEAISVAGRVRPDLIFTEEQMPTFGALAQGVREHPELSPVPVVIVNPDAGDGARYGDAVVLTDFDQLWSLLPHHAESHTDS